MATRREKRTATHRRTLFDARLFERFPFKPGCDTVEEAGRDGSVHPDEAATFRALCINEDHVAPTQESGCVFGPLTVRLRGRKRARDLSKGAALEIPFLPERDEVELLSCDADAILYAEQGYIGYYTRQKRIWRQSNCVVVGGCGIPAYHIRRFLHRLSTQFNLPVYVLAENDTWGYFHFSVLKRGMVQPDRRCTALAVKDLRYLGLRAGDHLLMPDPERVLRPWKPTWNARLRAMARYPCFKSAAWKNEFAAFRRAGGALDWTAPCGIMGHEWVVHEYVLPRIAKGQYLR